MDCMESIKVQVSDVLEKGSETDVKLLASTLGKLVSKSSSTAYATFTEHFLQTLNQQHLHQQHYQHLQHLQHGVDIIKKVPVEIAIYIFAYLDAKSLGRAQQVSRYWRQVVCEDVWRRACGYFGFGQLDKWQKQRESRVLVGPGMGVGSSERALKLWTAPSLHKLRAPWKRVMIENYLTQLNWEMGQCHVQMIKPRRRRSLPSIATPTALDTNVPESSITLSFDDRLSLAMAVSPSSATPPSGHLWDMRTESLHIDLVGHQGVISAVKLDSKKIVTGGADRTVRIWDVDNGQCLKTLIGHEGEIECVQFDDRWVVSGSSDGTVRVWDVETGDCIAVLRGHSDSVTCLHFDKDKIVTGSSDTTIRVWGTHDFRCKHELVGHTAHVYCIQAHGDHLISGSADNSIKIWDYRHSKCLRTLEGDQGGVVCLQTDGNKIVSGSGDQAIKVWSYKTGQLLYSLKRHSGPVWNLKFDSTKIMSSSFDQTVAVWDFSASNMSKEDAKRYGVYVDGDNDEDIFDMDTD